MAATVVIGVVVGLAGGSLIRSDGRQGTIVTLPPLEAVASLPPEVIVPVIAPPPAPTDTMSLPRLDPRGVAVPVAPRLYSEADLMAVLPDEEMRAAVMRAEWFVTDFFTVEGATSAESDVKAAMAGGLAGGPLPHGAAESAISYVEWARAYLVEPVEPGTYRVSVTFRTLSGPGPSELLPSNVRAVAISVQVGAEGATIVLDLPSPLSPPSALAAALPAFSEGEPPEGMVESAFVAARSGGTEPATLLAGADDSGWLVVVMVGDDSGLRWPLVVRP
jgi:hypothetical protein